MTSAQLVKCQGFVLCAVIVRHPTYAQMINPNDFDDLTLVPWVKLFTHPVKYLNIYKLDWDKTFMGSNLWF